MSNKVVNTTCEINKKNSKEFTKSINKNIKKMRKSNFNEKDYNNILLGCGATSETFKIRINSINLTCKKIKSWLENGEVEIPADIAGYNGVIATLELQKKPSIARDFEGIYQELEAINKAVKTALKTTMKATRMLHVSSKVSSINCLISRIKRQNR